MKVLCKIIQTKEHFEVHQQDVQDFIQMIYKKVFASHDFQRGRGYDEIVDKVAIKNFEETMIDVKFSMTHDGDNIIYASQIIYRDK